MTDPTRALAEALADLRAGRLDAAAKRSQDLLGRAAQDPAVHQLAAAVALRRGDFEAAGRWARSCLALRPGHVPALIIAGRAARGRGDTALALACLARAAELAPERPEPAFLTCVTLLEAGDPTASDALERLLRLFPDDAEGWHEVGLALQRAKKPEAALAAFTRAAQAGANPLHRLHQAMALQALGRLKEAIAAFRLALGLAPDLVEASLRLAQCLRLTGAPGAACGELERIVAHDESDDRAWFALGLARQDLRDLPGAILAYRRAASLRPDFPEAQVNLGLSLQQSGDLEGAMEAYRRAVRLRADTFGRIAQGLASASKGQMWLDLRRLRRSLGA